MIYRDTLYAAYSTSFAEGKAFQPEVQFAQYDAVYDLRGSDKSSAVLDVGCGKGEWLAWLSHQGFTNLCGVDASESDLQVAASLVKDAKLIRGYAADFLKDRRDAFDLIHGKDVAEHMTKDEFIAFLKQAHAALRPGGRLWLLTFNAQAPLAAATRYGDFTHELGLTPRSAAQCLRACGFDRVAVRGVHYCTRSPGGQARRLLSSFVHRIARVMLRLRHGGSGTTGDVDEFSPLPDMFVSATRA